MANILDDDETTVTSPPGAPETPPKTPTETPPPVGDPDVVGKPAISGHKPLIAPVPLKI